MSGALYNENDDYAASWLENLAAAGHIAPGAVDRRSIADLRAEDVAQVTQFHTFAGIGVWSHALRLAGWPDEAPVWTGSCPCQPLSQAGRQRGLSDERHLWPEWFRLIAACRPPVIFAEQVASQLGLAWLDAVQSDLEGAGYAVWPFDLCAAGVGAPHQRQRLYIAAIRLDLLEHAGGTRGRRNTGAVFGAQDQGESERLGVGHLADEPVTAGSTLSLANSELHHRSGRIGEAHGRSKIEPDRHRDASVLADDDDEGRGGERTTRLCIDDDASRGTDVDGRGPTNGHWADAEWIPCRDGKWRAIKPGPLKVADGSAESVGRVRAQAVQEENEDFTSTFPLIRGARDRGRRLKGYGNAIVAPLAAEFIRAVMDTLLVVSRQTDH